jgi:hypothetical protein
MCRSRVGSGVLTTVLRRSRRLSRSSGQLPMAVARKRLRTLANSGTRLRSPTHQQIKGGESLNPWSLRRRSTETSRPKQ